MSAACDRRPLLPSSRAQAHVDGAQLIELEAAHLSNVETGDEFTRPVLAFLRG